MITRATLLAALCALAATTGCGDDDGPPSSQQQPAGDTVAITAPNETVPAPGPKTTLAPEDKRGVAMACIRDEKGIAATPVGDKGIAIDVDGQKTRIDFFQSSLEAEGEQFEGRAEGAEQVGAALFYVRELPEQALVDIEDCLNDQ
jgi:hypothetical protein